MQSKNKFSFNGALEYHSSLSVTKVSETECLISNGAIDLVDNHGSSGGSYTEKGNHAEVFLNKLREEYQTQIEFLGRVQKELDSVKEDEYPDQGVLQDYYNMLKEPCYDPYFVGNGLINLKYTGEFELENGKAYKFYLSKVEDGYRLVAESKNEQENLEFSFDKNPTQAFYSGFDELITKIEEWLGQPSKGESK